MRGEKRVRRSGGMRWERLEDDEKERFGDNAERGDI